MRNLTFKSREREKEREGERKNTIFFPQTEVYIKRKIIVKQKGCVL